MRAKERAPHVARPFMHAEVSLAAGVLDCDLEVAEGVDLTYARLLDVQDPNALSVVTGQFPVTVGILGLALGLEL